MEQTVVLQKQLRDEVAADIANRTAAHQVRIARLKLGRTKAIGAGRQPAMPLLMLAHGDSWFDHPLTGNGFPFTNTDIIAQLSGMGAVNPVILNMSHHGDATTDELSLSKQQQLIEALDNQNNWINGKPDAILFSGGGNDIVGERFYIFLNYATAGSMGLHPEIRRRRPDYRPLLRFSNSQRQPPGVCRALAATSLQYCGWTTIDQG
jgi:hypothetical protein